MPNCATYNNDLLIKVAVIPKENTPINSTK